MHLGSCGWLLKFLLFQWLVLLTSYQRTRYLPFGMGRNGNTVTVDKSVKAHYCDNVIIAIRHLRNMKQHYCCSLHLCTSGICQVPCHFFQMAYSDADCILKPGLKVITQVKHTQRRIQRPHTASTELFLLSPLNLNCNVNTKPKPPQYSCSGEGGRYEWKKSRHIGKHFVCWSRFGHTKKVKTTNRRFVSHDKDSSV